MRVLGPASASQVVAAYRYDFVVEQSGQRWPDQATTALEKLPMERLRVMEQAGRPLFWILEATWELVELSREELWDVIAMWDDFSMRLGDLVARALDGRYSMSAKSQANLRRIRALRRDGVFRLGELVAVRPSLLKLSYPESAMCLLDGHHRILALALDEALPDVFPVLLGNLPVHIGTAVLNSLH